MPLNGTIAITDYDWYRVLLATPDSDEVNFWKPSPRATFRGEPNSPFLFKLRSPHNAICGYGFFERFSVLPDWLAWELFGIANGCSGLESMRRRIRGIRSRMRFRGKLHESRIGCLLVLAPVFFTRDQWIEQPRDWPARTQTVKGYDLTRGEGRRVWEECLARSGARQLLQAPMGSSTAIDTGDRYGEPVLVRPRKGHGTFRVAVLEAYRWSCAATSEHSLPALEAAHIRPFKQNGPNEVNNGLLLRADLHRIFDKGYMTVTQDHHIEVSKTLRDDYDNGRTYYPLHGQKIWTPSEADEAPAQEYINWHNENVYRG